MDEPAGSLQCSIASKWLILLHEGTAKVMQCRVGNLWQPLQPFPGFKAKFVAASVWQGSAHVSASNVHARTKLRLAVSCGPSPHAEQLPWLGVTHCSTPCCCGDPVIQDSLKREGNHTACWTSSTCVPSCCSLQPLGADYVEQTGDDAREG